MKYMKESIGRMTMMMMSRALIVHVYVVILEST
jgi:hypothetical protein